MSDITSLGRPITEPNNPSIAIAVADMRAVVYNIVARSKKLWIKNVEFSITNLVIDKQLGIRFANRAVVSFKLFL